MFLKVTGKPNNYQFYLTNFFKFCDNISHKLFRPSQSSAVVHFAEINQGPP